MGSRRAGPTLWRADLLGAGLIQVAPVCVGEFLTEIADAVSDRPLVI
jgi:hypothetical protein